MTNFRNFGNAPKIYLYTYDFELYIYTDILLIVVRIIKGESEQHDSYVIYNSTGN
jgi:hypothetical protein